MPSKKPIPDTYKGLIVAQCNQCGEATVFYSENEVDSFVCKHCHKQVEFDCSPVPLISFCECGNRIRAVTNSTQDTFQFNCKCGYPNSVEYSSRKNKYFGMR